MKLSNILSELAKPIPSKFISKKGIYKNKKLIDEIDYISWIDCCRLLDDRCGNDQWEWSVINPITTQERIFLTGVLTIHGDDKSITRMATGTELLNCGTYGDPSSNAEAMAIRRCSAKLGLGRNLYNKKKQPTKPQNYSTIPVKPVTNLSNDNTISFPKNSPEYWKEQGRKDALQKIPAKFDIKPYMEGYEEIAPLEEEKEWDFEKHF